VPLSNTDLVARWEFEEADSGTSPASVADVSGVGSAWNLTTVDYGSGNAAWMKVGSKRGWESTSVNGTQRVARQLTEGTKIYDTLNGKQKLTLELLVQIDALNGGNGRVVVINDNAGSDPVFGLAGTSLSSVTIHFNGTNAGSVDLSAFAGQPIVVHLEIDTTQATAADRRKLYVNGSAQTISGGSSITQNAGMDTGERDWIIFNRQSGGSFDRSCDGIMFYCAVYENVLSGTDRTNNSDYLLGLLAVGTPEPNKGIATGGSMWYFGDSDVAADMKMIKAVGARMIRTDMYWDEVETSDGTFDWSKPDRIFDAADALGIKVQFLVHRTPSWARGGAGTDLTYPTNASDYGDFCEAAVNRYKARGTLGCHHWEFWNEPNANWAATDVGDTGAAKLAAMINDAVPKIKTADPTAIVVGPGIIRGGSAASSTYRLDTEYLAALYSEGLDIGILDMMGFHPYTYPYDPDNAGITDVNHGFNRIDDMRAVLVAAGDDIPLCITEWGQHTGSAAESVSEEKQAQYLRSACRLYEDLFASGDVAGPLFVYQHRDSGTNAANKEENFGLSKNDRTTTKQAQMAYAGFLSQSYVWTT